MSIFSHHSENNPLLRVYYALFFLYWYLNIE